MEMDEIPYHEAKFIDQNGVSRIVRVPVVQELARRRVDFLPERFIRVSPDDLSPPSSVQNWPDVSDPVPAIDISKIRLESGLEDRDRELDKLGRAAKEWGMFLIKNHGIESEVLNDVRTVVKGFFGLSSEEKKSSVGSYASIDNMGYGRNFVKSENQPLDWIDRLSMKAAPKDATQGLHVWPQNPPNFRPAIEKYVEGARQMCDDLLQALAESISADRHVFLKHFDQRKSEIKVRVNYYPPCPRPELAMGVIPHTDSSALSVLIQFENSGGLQPDDAVSLQPQPPPPPLSLSHQIPRIQVDDDEEEVRSDQIAQSEVGITLQTINLSSSNSNSVNPNISRHNPTITDPIPFNISDDEMDEVVNEPSPINPVSFRNNPVYDGTNAILRKMGLGLKREWLEACIGALQSSIQGFLGLDDSQRAKLCFEQFLFADMNYCGCGVLPRDVHNLHLVDLKGPYILQVDEMVNISSPIRSRYQKAAPGFKRCLKLSMTDGVQCVFGMEYRPIKDLEVLSSAGLKIVLCNVNVRRGILMLVPEVIKVLGGKVEELDAAQQRLVHEINKPARGKRTGVVPKLSERATLAAWPSETVNVQDQINNSRTVAMPFQVDMPGTSSGIPSSGISASDGTEEHHRGNIEANQSSAADIAGVHFVAEQAQPSGRMTRDENEVPIPGEEVGPNLVEAMDVQEFQMLEELEHSFMLTGEREFPFTYLSSLSAKWATMNDTVSKVQGTVKCFLTSVKGFQYKRRTTYELRVYIDDGSLISEILIDHSVVQNGIGYSPEEVSKALASSDSSQVSQMKETLKQFQIFLVNFEGTMLIQMSEESSVPVAIEMNQGCSVSDAWLLLQRLSTSSSAQKEQNSHLNAPSLSP